MSVKFSRGIIEDVRRREMSDKYRNVLWGIGRVVKMRRELHLFQVGYIWHLNYWNKHLRYSI